MRGIRPRPVDDKPARIGFPRLFAQIGLIPADTEFNRRAQAYTRDAARIIGQRKHAAQLRASKKKGAPCL